MFEKWLKNHNLSEVNFDGQLFPDASDREFWPAYMTENEVREAEEYLDYSWPLIRASQFIRFQTEGDRLSHEEPYFARRKALTKLILGELAEYKGRFLPELCDGVFLVCEETFWGLSAHLKGPFLGQQLPSAGDPYIDLFAAETAELMVVLRHLFANALGEYCPELLERIDFELERRIIKPYLEHTDFRWMGYEGNKVNNWNPWILSNVLTVFLLQVKDTVRLETGIRKMFKELNFYYRSMPEDGGCDEGPGYWDVAGGRLFALCDRLYVLSGGAVNLFGDDKLKKILSFPLYAHISGCRFANFADGSSRIMDDTDYVFYGNGLRIGEPRLCALAATMKKAQALEAPIWMRRVGALCSELYGRIYAGDIEACPVLDSESSCALPDTQVAFLRQGDWYCAAKGGFNAESHNHNDVGHFMVYHRGMPVLVDPGCGVYRKETFTPELRYHIWTMQSCWHNLPTLNGCDQLPGREYRAEEFTVADHEAEISFAGAYGPESGVTAVRRQITLREDGLTFTDSFAFTGEKNTATENFMTTHLPVMGDNCVVLGEKYVLCADMPCRIAIDRQEIKDDSKLFADWKTDALYRIRFSFDCGSQWTGKFTVKAV